MTRMETSLERAEASGPQVRKYSSRHHLRKDMVGNHTVLSVFVSGASTFRPVPLYDLLTGCVHAVPWFQVV